MTGVIDRFLRPRRIALVGVSRDPDALTARPAHYLRSWAPDLDVVAVHPSAPGPLHGHPVVPRIRDAGSVDVALLLLPADGLESALEECAATGVRGVISVASGFSGPEGARRRERLRAILTASDDLRLLGPNCVGLVSPATSTVLSFSSVLLQERPRSGHVGLVTQSGAIGNAIMLALTRRGVGLAHWLSTGDELDVGAMEVAAALARDPACRAVGLFVEGITDPEWLPDLAAAIEETGTRVVALRSAASAAGRRAAFGHTGRVVGDDEIARAALRDAGVILVDSLTELTDVLTVLSALPPPPPATNRPLRVAVVTVSGGTGVLAADAIERAPGLTVANLESNADQVRAALDVPVTVDNPLDVAVLGRPDVFPHAIEAVTRIPSVDAVVTIVSTLAHDYDLLADARYEPDTPLVMTHLSPEERFTPAQAGRLATRGIPSVPSAVSAVRALSIWAARPEGRAVGIRTESHDPPTGIPLGQAIDVLGLADVAAPLCEATDVDEVVAFARQHDAVAIKAAGLRIAHRADYGAVEVGLRSEDEIREAWVRVSDICRQFGDRPLAQAMASPGIEVMLTALHDPEVGPAVVLRPGGAQTELMAGTVILTGDPSIWGLERMGDGPLRRLLGGWRGRAGGDVPALMDLARRLRVVVLDGGTVECNPVIVHGPGDGVTVVDVLASPDLAARP